MMLLTEHVLIGLFEVGRFINSEEAEDEARSRFPAEVDIKVKSLSFDTESGATIVRICVTYRSKHWEEVGS